MTPRLSSGKAVTVADLRDVGRGFAWRIDGPDGGLCYWAQPSRVALERDAKPSPEAKAEPVYIVPRKTWLHVRAALKAALPKTKKRGKR